MALAREWYFKIDDVHGDSEERQHRTWIEAESWNLHSRGAGLGVGRARSKELSLVMATGPASARFMSAMTTGHTFMKAQLHGVLNGNTVERHTYTHLRVIHFNAGGQPLNGRVLEQITFEYDVLPNS